jgi:hypothetical protein
VNELSVVIGKKFSVDLLLTIGSQVALFEELKLFTTSDPKVPSDTVRKVKELPGAKKWFNVYNRLDVLSFLAAPVFDAAEDFEASTTAGVTDAHGAYFENMVFYQRVNVRLRAMGLL